MRMEWPTIILWNDTNKHKASSTGTETSTSTMKDHRNLPVQNVDIG